MDFLTWITTKRGALGMVRGGRPRDIVDLLFETSTTLPTIIGDRTTNEEILAARVLHGGPRPRMHVSRGLRHDLPVMVQASRSGPVLVVPHVTLTYLADESQRVAAQVVALAGYLPPHACLEQVAVERVTMTLHDMLGHLTAPLLVHDAAAQFPRTELTGFSVFGYAVTATAPQPGVADAQPSDAVIVEHARFLAKTDLATLRSMHAPFLHESAAAIFDTWDSYFEAMQLDADHRELAVRARQVLRGLKSPARESDLKIPNRVTEPEMAARAVSGQRITARDDTTLDTAPRESIDVPSSEREAGAATVPAKPSPTVASGRPKAADPADIQLRQRLEKPDLMRRVQRTPILRPGSTSQEQPSNADPFARSTRRSDANPAMTGPTLTGVLADTAATQRASVDRDAPEPKKSDISAPVAPSHQSIPIWTRPVVAMEPKPRSPMRRTMMNDDGQFSQSKVTVASAPAPSSSVGVFRVLRPNKT